MKFFGAAEPQQKKRTEDQEAKGINNLQIDYNTNT